MRQVLTAWLLLVVACVGSQESQRDPKEPKDVRTGADVALTGRIAAIDAAVSYRHLWFRDTVALDYCGAVHALGGTPENLGRLAAETRKIVTRALSFPCKPGASHTTNRHVVVIEGISETDSTIILDARILQSGYQHRETFTIGKYTKRVGEHRLHNFIEFVPELPPATRTP